MRVSSMLHRGRWFIDQIVGPSGTTTGREHYLCSMLLSYTRLLAGLEETLYVGILLLFDNCRARSPRAIGVMRWIGLLAVS